MALDPQLKIQLRRLYIFDRFTLEQASNKLGLSIGTARRWKKEAEEQGDDWDKMRDVQALAGGEVEDIAKGLLTGFLIQYKSLMAEIEQNDTLTSAEKVDLLGNLADSFAKMTASSKRLIPVASEIATALRVIEMLVDLIKKQKAELLPAFLELLDELELLVQKEFK